MARTQPFKYTTCAICGKEFIKAPGSIYHVNFAGRSCQCCSYTCYQKAKETKCNHVESKYVKLKKEGKHHEKSHWSK